MRWLVAVLPIICLTCVADDQPKKVALFIGVTNYDKPSFEDLPGAENDARALSSEFQSLGFETHLLTSSGGGDKRASLKQIKAELDRLISPLSKRDVFVLGLAGHGLQMESKEGGKTRVADYFCPTDANLDNLDSLLPLDEVIGNISANVGTGLLLIDACRNSPVESRGIKSRGAVARFRSAGIAGRSMQLPSGMAVLFSCAEGQRSMEHPEKPNGIFTSTILDELKQMPGEVEWLSLASKVTARMASEDVESLLPKGVKQNPVLASNVGRAVLARQGVANPGGSGTNFGWKFEEGKEFYLYTSTDLVSQYDFTGVPQTKGVNFWERIQLNRVFRYKPLHRLPNGGWRFEVRLEGIQSKFENSDLVKEEWSSYSNQKPAERFAGFQQILGATFIYELDKDMRVASVEVLGVESLAQQFLGMQTVPAEISNDPAKLAEFSREFKKGFSEGYRGTVEKTVRQSTNEFFSLLPGRPINKGDAWQVRFRVEGELGEFEGSAHHRFVGNDPKGLKVEMKGNDVVFYPAKKFALEAMKDPDLKVVHSKGNAYFNSKKGRIDWADIWFKTKGHFVMENKELGRYEIPHVADYGTICEIYDQDPLLPPAK